MKIFALLNESLIDNSDDSALGYTDSLRDIEYFGYQVEMNPDIFLKLTTPNNWQADEDSKKFINNALNSGKKISSPFLKIFIPEGWFEDEYNGHAKVVGHEGRHRMVVLQELQGNKLVPVSLKFTSNVHELRSRHIKLEWKEQIQKGLVSQFTNTLVKWK